MITPSQKLLMARAGVSAGTIPVKILSEGLASGYTVSSDGLTLTRNGNSTSTNYQYWSVGLQKLPKVDETFYWEISLSGGPSTWNGYLGAVSSGTWQDYNVGVNPVYGDSLAFRGNGDIWGDGSETTTPPTVGTRLETGLQTFGNLSVVMLGFNALTGTIHTGVDGVWDGTYTLNPGSGVGSAADYHYPSLQLRDAVGQSLTLLSTSEQFNYTSPVGWIPYADAALYE